MQAKELGDGVKAAKGDLKLLRDEFKKTLDVLNTSPKSYGFTDTAQIKAARAEVQKLIRDIEKLQAAGKTNLSKATPKQTATIKAGVAGSQAAIVAATPSTIIRQQQQEEAIGIRLALRRTQRLH